MHDYMDNTMRPCIRIYAILLSLCRITVMASDINDAWYYVNPTAGSNYGLCTHIIAPVRHHVQRDLRRLNFLLLFIPCMQGVNIVSTSRTGGSVALTGNVTPPHMKYDNNNHWHVCPLSSDDAAACMGFCPLGFNIL